MHNFILAAIFGIPPLCIGIILIINGIRNFIFSTNEMFKFLGACEADPNDPDTPETYIGMGIAISLGSIVFYFFGFVLAYIWFIFYPIIFIALLIIGARLIVDLMKKTKAEGIVTYKLFKYSFIFLHWIGACTEKKEYENGWLFKQYKIIIQKNS